MENNPNAFPLENTPSISLTSSFTGTTNLVEGTANTNREGGERPSSSRNGRIVAYEKSVNGNQQIYYMDMLAGGEPIPKSRNFQTDRKVTEITTNQKLVKMEVRSCFIRVPSDLVPGDFNDQMDVFLFRLASAELVRANNKNLGVEANGPSFNPSVSGDGKLIVFESLATNLQTSGGDFRPADLCMGNRKV